MKHVKGQDRANKKCDNFNYFNDGLLQTVIYKGPNRCKYDTFFWWCCVCLGHDGIQRSHWLKKKKNCVRFLSAHNTVSIKPPDFGFLPYVKALGPISTGTGTPRAQILIS